MNFLKLIVKNTIVLFFLGLIIGAIFFFPSNTVKTYVLDQISANSGMQVSAKSMSLGTGLGMGITRGGVLSIDFEELKVMNNASVFSCEEASISPQFLPLFLGKLKVGVSCDGKGGSDLATTATLSPFWNPETIDLDVDLKGFSLASVSGFMSGYPIRGRAYGTFEIKNMSLNSRALPPMQWKLSLQKAVLPALTSDFVSLPEINLGTLDSTGSLENNKLKMPHLQLGNSTAPLDAKLEIDLALNQRMIPTGGEIKGHLKASPEWEAQIKDTLDLNLMFGKPNAEGVRSFRKPLTNGLFSLLSEPLPYK